MTRRRSRGFSRASGPKNQLWTVFVAEQLNIQSSITELVLVQSSDWAIGGGLERATLLRIRGWFSAAPLKADVSKGALFACIYKVDEDGLPVSPLTAAMYTDEDVLWTGGMQVSGVTAGTVEARPGFQFDVDVKSMRRFTSGEEIRLSLATAVGLDFDLSGVMRCLVRKGGN